LGGSLLLFGGFNAYFVEVHFMLDPFLAHFVVVEFGGVVVE